MGSSAEVCEWWMTGIKGEPAPQRTVAGSAAALVGSFSPSRRNTPKVRSWSDSRLLEPQPGAEGRTPQIRYWRQHAHARRGEYRQICCRNVEKNFI